MIYGWVFASIAGIIVGAIIGSSRIAREYVAPMLEMVRPVPVSAFMPVVIAFLGLTGKMVTVVIAIGSVWPVLLATVHGVSSVEPRLLEVSRSLRLVADRDALENRAAEFDAGYSRRHADRADGVADPRRDRRNAHQRKRARLVRPDRRAFVPLGRSVRRRDRARLIGLVSNLALQEIERYMLRWKRR